jgi:hypothetical protein
MARRFQQQGQNTQDGGFENGSSTVLRNVGIQPQRYTTQQLRKTTNSAQDGGSPLVGCQETFIQHIHSCHLSVKAFSSNRNGRARMDVLKRNQLGF